MATVSDTLRAFFRRGDIVARYISINLVLFLVFALVRVVLRLFAVTDAAWLNVLALPADTALLLTRPWTPLTYMFMHAGVWHLLFNMLWLWWFGGIFLQLFSARHLRALYLLGGLVGGLFYVLGYNVFPLFHPQLSGSYLVGASASILAVVIAIAVYQPSYRINLAFFGAVTMKWVAVVTVVIDVLLIASSNAGGHMAHLGGALSGWAFAAALRHGHDITAWLNAIIDFVWRLFHPAASIARLRQRRMRVYRQPRASKAKKENLQPGNRHASDYQYNASRRQQDDEIDHILDKIKQHGYAGLSADEKRKLFEASER